MTTFEKLNLKSQDRILVLHAPGSFEPELAALRGVAIARTLEGLDEIGFSLAFVTTRQQVDQLAAPVARTARGDAVVWFAYPKGTSKRYRSEINRDHGWEALRQLGFETVRSVALDQDWTALRFRRAEFVKAASRKRA